MTTTYPDKLFASVRGHQRDGARLNELNVEVGFKDRRIAPLAIIHEFGARAFDGITVPERPAFRSALGGMERVLEEHSSGWRDVPTQEQIEELAQAWRDLVRRAYMEFHGAPLAERTRERKEGTPFADEQLIGSEGPRMISHIHAYVDGSKV